MNEKMKLILDTMVKGKWKAPAGELIGFTLIEYGEGNAIYTLKADKRLHNPMGQVHGGIMCDIMDAAMGIAMVTTLEENENFTTVNLQVNFLKAVTEADLIAEGIVVNRGKTIGYVECNLKDDAGNLIAVAQSTCMVIRDKRTREY